MRHAQIERLRALKKMIKQDWSRPNGTVDAGAVLANVEELVNILLREGEGNPVGVVVPPDPKGRIE